MSDKLRTSFPISVDFYEGELPSAAKMNGLAKQAKQGLSLIEYAIGDMWNQSGDSFLSAVDNAPLLIPNISRYLGAPRQLNPRIPNLPNIESYTHTFSGTYEEQLDFTPHSSETNFVWTNSTNNSTPESSKEDVDAANKWYLNYQTGHVFSYNLLSLSTTITYQPGYYDESGTEQYGIHGDIAEDADYNMIPDPQTDIAYNFRGLKIESTAEDDTYHIYLPPRMPLQSSRQLNFYPDYANNNAAAPDVAHDTKFFQSNTANACTSTDAEHYRYTLPRLLTDSTSWTSGALIPTGFMYLYDEYGTGTIIDGVTFYAESAGSPRKWVLVAKGANLTTWLSTTQGLSQYPTATLESTTHVAANYPVNGLKLITIGTNLSTALSSLLKQYLNHDHNSQGSFPSRQLSHVNMMDLFDLNEFANLSGNTFKNDHHPQYLHRQGYNTTRHGNNAMLGDLVLADLNNGSDLNTDTHSLIFGNTSGAKVSWDASEYSLRMDLPNKVSSNLGSLKLFNKNHSSEPGYDTSLTVGRIYPGAHNDSTYGSSTDFGPVRLLTLAPDQFVYGEGPGGSSPDRVLWENLENPFYGNVTGTYTESGYSTARHSFFAGNITNPSALGRTTYAQYTIGLPYKEYAIVDLQFDYAAWRTDLSAGQALGTFDWDFFRVVLQPVDTDSPWKEVKFGDTDFSSGFNPALPTASEQFVLCSSCFGHSYSQTLNDASRTMIRFENHTGHLSNYNLLFKGLVVKYRIKEW